MRLQFLDTYFKELAARLESKQSKKWMCYQNDRLNRIRWLVDEKDDGLAAGFNLKMRPYDVPWFIIGLSRIDSSTSSDKVNSNGSAENRKKILACPAMKVEFTDRYADYCYLCKDMLTEGCVAHPDFGDYGKIFPQPNQMNQRLRDDCQWVLDHLELEWSSVIEVRDLAARCLKYIPEPSAFPDAPAIRKNFWDQYRAGIRYLEKWIERQT